MKLARIALATVALLSAAACSSDRITGPAAPQAPASAASPSAPHATLLPGDSVGVNLDVTCTTSSKIVNGVLTLVTTCDSGWLGGGN